MKTKLLLLICSCIGLQNVFGQATDKFTGRWFFSKTDIENKTYSAELLIASSEQQTLYPAQLTIQYANFTGVYHLLLVKKNEYQLVIGRQKNPVKELPFSIGAYTIPLNGTLDLKNGNALEVNRVKAKRYGFAVPALSVYEEENKTTVMRVSEFLRNEPILLQKANSDPWRSGAAGKMLYTHGNTEYFGLTDSFYVNKAEGIMRFNEGNQSDDDTVSVKLNKKMIVDQIDLNKNTPAQSITLDTGLNILCFFADNYGRVPPNTAKLNLSFGAKSFSLDFTTRENMSANFMVAKIYLLPDKQKTPEEVVARNIISQKVETRQIKWIDSISSESDEVTIAFWDDAVEDGDSISLQINDEIFLPGLAVKKQPKFIKVKLYTGENKIIFIADNLGAIPPNTSMLEIIDGKKRRSYMIDNDMRRNSAIKISYQLDR
jgi:hypothetical protein